MNINAVAATLPTDPVTDVVTIESAEVLFSNIVGIALGFGGILLFIMLIIGGFNYITAGGDSGKAQAAQKTITWAVGGLVFVAASFLIIRLIATFTHTDDILFFKLVQPDRSISNPVGN